MSTRTSRQYRRVGIACENCRRKKTRCLGQRPKCSACTRLGQRCVYEGDEPDSNEDVVTRLRQLEDQLNTLNDKFEQRPAQDETPSSASGIRTTLPESAPATIQSNLPPSSLVRKAFDVYFERIHRQPMWLFETAVSPTPNTSEELICAILALSLTYGADQLSSVDFRSPKFYYDTARRRVLLQVADGIPDLQSIKVLCLLAFFNVVSGDLPLAGFNISLAQNLIHYSTIALDASHGSFNFEERSRVFWSITVLNTFYGPPILIPMIDDDINAPCFSTTELRPGQAPCPPIPQEVGVSSLPGVWSHSLRLGNLWGQVRVFISRCMEGSTEAPWNLNSDYHALYARSLDLETTHRPDLSYNHVRFADRNSEDVNRDRLEWVPWLRMQVTYHTVHCVLNHPFLYSSKISRQKFGKNSFWRESSEKALRHCNWVSRILRLPKEKGIHLHDPFFAQAAGIAATLSLYWTRENDLNVRNKALENFEICQTLITDMALHLPVCKTIEQSLLQFKNFVSPLSPRQMHRLGSSKVKPTTALKWLLLDIASPQFPSYSNIRSSGATDDGLDEATLHSPDIGTPRTGIRESTRHYASPPEWISSQADETPETGTRPDLSIAQQEEFHHSFNRMMSGGEYDETDFNLAWGPWEQIGGTGNNSTAGLEWWDFTTL